MTLGKEIKNLSEKCKAQIFGKLYSVASSNEHDLFVRAVNGAAIAFESAVNDWVESAKGAVAANQFPKATLKIESMAFKYYLEKSSEAEELSRNAAKHSGYIDFFQDKISCIMQAKQYCSDYSEVGAVKERIKLALFLDAAICVFDKALENLFSDENHAETEAQIQTAFKNSNVTVSQAAVLAIQEQQRILLSLIEKIYKGEGVAQSKENGYAYDFFEIYEDYNAKMDSIFDMLEKIECLPTQVSCTYFGFLCGEFSDEERKKLLDVTMY